MNFCPLCGTKIEGSWNTCPNCGNELNSEQVNQQPTQAQIPVQTISQPQPQHHPDNYHPSSNNTYGIVALIFGLLGLFVIPIVGGIIGIVLGAIGKNKDDEPTMAKVGLALGIVGIIVWIAVIIWIISMISMLFSFLPIPYY